MIPEFPERRASAWTVVKPIEIQVGDSVLLWLPVTAVSGESITVADHVTTGIDSVIERVPKNRTPDEIWARLSDAEKRELLNIPS